MSTDARFNFKVPKNPVLPKTAEVPEHVQKQLTKALEEMLMWRDMALVAESKLKT